MNYWINAFCTSMCCLIFCFKSEFIHHHVTHLLCSYIRKCCRVVSSLVSSRWWQRPVRCPWRFLQPWRLQRELAVLWLSWCRLVETFPIGSTRYLKCKTDVDTVYIFGLSVFFTGALNSQCKKIKECSYPLFALVKCQRLDGTNKKIVMQGKIFLVSGLSVCQK